MARVRRGKKVKHLCLVCVRGQEYEEEPIKETRDWLRNYWIRDWPQGSQEEPITLVKTQVYVANITSELVNFLSANPGEIYNLSPGVFEELICDRFQRMGFGIVRGGHVYQKDGGIDIVAWRENTPFPFCMAIQVKHHRSPKQKTGPSPVRELLGVVNPPFHAGVLVTNTTFTPDAKWAAELKPMLVRLRDIHDIQRWLEDNFLDAHDWREMPDEIEVCPGIVLPIPKPKLS